MKIPSSPLLLGLALSSTTLAYPTPKDRSHNSGSNPESSPLLSTPNTPVVGGSVDDGWGDLPPRISRRWGKRQMNMQGMGGPASGLLGSAAGGLFGSLTGGSSNSVQGLSGTVGGLAKNPSGVLDGLGLNGGGVGEGIVGGTVGMVGSTLGGVSGLTGGLPIVGGLVNGVEGSLNGLPLVGGLIGGVGVNGVTGAGAGAGGGGVGGVTQGFEGSLGGLPLVGGLIEGLGGTVNGLPVDGGLTSGSVNLGTDPLQGTTTGQTGLGSTGQVIGEGNAPQAISDTARSGKLASQGVMANTLPGVVANLGEGRYLLSNGKILSLGDLSNLESLSSLGNQGSLGSLSDLGGGTIGSLTGGVANGQATGKVNGLTGLDGVGSIGSAQTGVLNGAVGQAQGNAIVGSLNNGITGIPLGSTQSPFNGVTPQSPLLSVPVGALSGLTDNRMVNLGGHIIPLDQAKEILHQHGLDGLLGQFALDPESTLNTNSFAGEAYDEGNTDPKSKSNSNSGTDTPSDGSPGDHLTPAQAFQASDPIGFQGNNTSTSTSSNSTSINSTYPNTDSSPPSTNTLLASVRGMTDQWDDSSMDEPWSDADIEKDGRWARPPLGPSNTDFGSGSGSGQVGSGDSVSDESNERVGYGSSLSNMKMGSTGTTSGSGSGSGSGGGGGGYENPFPEYQYDKGKGALDLVAGIMGAPRPPTESSFITSTTPTSTTSTSNPASTSPLSSITPSASALPSGVASGIETSDGSVTGFDFVGKPRQGWNISKPPLDTTGYSRPPSASTSATTSASTSTSTSSSSSSTGAESGSWNTDTPSAPSAGTGPDGDDQWGEWVSGEPSPSPVPTPH